MRDRDTQLEAEDSAARAAALVVTDSILLQAPAGSGKTTVLTQRYLKLLSCVDTPEQVLAITFTRKATGELRTRVRRALDGSMQIRSPADQLTLEVARAASARHPALLQQSHRLKIMTIDAWHMYLASRLPVTARSNVALRLADDATRLYRRAARAAIEYAEHTDECQDAVQLALDIVDNRWHKLEELLITMLASRNTWLPAIVGSEPEHFVAIVERTVETMIEATLRDSRARLGESLVSTGAELTAHAARVLHDGHDAAGTAFLPWVGAVEPLTTQARDLPRWRAMVHLAMTQPPNSELRSPAGLNRKLGFPPEDKGAKARCQAWLASLAASESTQAALREIRALPTLPLDAETSGAMRALASMLLLAAQSLDALFTEQGECDYIAVAGAARQALSEDGAPTDLAERLGVALRHILVDEFQDTSREQCTLLESMMADWVPGDGRSLFLVGDPMQSIYQFRNADVGLFLAVREHGIGRIPLRKLALRRNFRSVPELVTFANETFARVFPRHDDSTLAAVSHLASTATLPTADDPSLRCITKLRVLPGGRNAEARAVLAAVRSLRAGRKRDSIAVLVSNRSHARAIVMELRQHGIPISGVDFTPLSDTSIVRDLEALTRALLHLADRGAWLAVLRAPWAALSLADLTALVGVDDDATVYEQLNALTAASGLTSLGLERAQRVCAVMSQALTEQGQRSLAEWVESTWLRLDGPAAALTAEELANATAFFGALGDLDSTLDNDLEASLARVLTTLYAPPDAAHEDAVIVTTIHQAKGLEFDHVILPGIGRHPRPDDPKLLEWLELPWHDGEPRLLVAPHTTIGNDDSDLRRYVRRLRRERGRFENARLLYVAMTRAKQSMLITAHPVSTSDSARPWRPASGSLLESLWPAVEHEIELWPDIGARPNDSATCAATAPAHAIRRLSSHYVRPETPADAARVALELASVEEQPEYRWASETARHIGTVVHRALERITKSGRWLAPTELATEAIRLRAELATLGVQGTELQDATELARLAIANTLADPKGRWILATSHRDAHSELALSGLEGRRVVNSIIDRTFVDTDGVRWIVDFKTSPHEGGDLEFFLTEQVRRYRPQLQRYARLVRVLGEAPVRAGLYFPLLQAWRECRLD